MGARDRAAEGWRAEAGVSQLQCLTLSMDGGAPGAVDGTSPGTHGLIAPGPLEAPVHTGGNSFRRGCGVSRHCSLGVLPKSVPSVSTHGEGLCASESGGLPT